MVGPPDPLFLFPNQAKWIGLPQEGMEFSLNPLGRGGRQRGIPKLGNLPANPAAVLLEGFVDLPHRGSVGGRHDHSTTGLDTDADRPPGRPTELEAERAVLKDELDVALGDGRSHGQSRIKEMVPSSNADDVAEQTASRRWQNGRWNPGTRPVLRGPPAKISSGGLTTGPPNRLDSPP